MLPKCFDKMSVANVITAKYNHHNGDNFNLFRPSDNTHLDVTFKERVKV